MQKSVNRRTVAAAIGAAAAMPVATLGLAKGAQLHRLIERHRAAFNVFSREIKKDDDWRPEVNAAHNAEKKAFWALCEHHCESIEEAREKARYLLTTATVKDFWDEEAQAMLASFAAN